MKRSEQTGFDIESHYCQQIQNFSCGWVLRPKTKPLLSVVTGCQPQLLTCGDRIPLQTKFDETFVVLRSIFPAVDPALHSGLRYVADRARPRRQCQGVEVLMKWKPDLVWKVYVWTVDLVSCLKHDLGTFGIVRQ